MKLHPSPPRHPRHQQWLSHARTARHDAGGLDRWSGAGCKFFVYKPFSQPFSATVLATVPTTYLAFILATVLKC